MATLKHTILIMSKLTPKQYLDSLKLIKELAIKDVASFICFNNDDYTKPKHLQPIIDEIDLICNGAVSKMMFSVPPQHYKSVSLLNAVALYLTKYPYKVVAYISYSQTFSQTQTRKAVQIYKHFNPNAKILIDTQKEFILEAGGGLITSSVDGGLTGYAIDWLIIDDPIKDRLEAESQTFRNRNIDWFNDVAKTRLRPDKTSITIVHTRWHNNDLIGYLQKNEPSIKYINLKAINDNNEPLLHNLEYYEQVKQANAYGFYSLYQGEPIGKSSHLFKEFVYTDVLPSKYSVSVGLDLAYTATSKADYSVYVVMLKDNETNKLTIIKAKCWQADINETKNILLRLRNEYPNIKFGIEANGTQKAIYDMLKDVLRPLKTMELKGDKFVRAQDFSSQWNLGNVLIYSKGDIDNQFFEQIAEFSGLKDLHDDFIDGAVYAYELSKKKEVEYRKFG
jgi:predicted phage terminase large subunit-like protein